MFILAVMAIGGGGVAGVLLPQGCRRFSGGYHRPQMRGPYEQTDGTRTVFVFPLTLNLTLSVPFLTEAEMFSTTGA